MNNMRNLLILLLLIPMLSFGQKKDKKIYASQVLETGGVLVIEGDTVYLDSPTNGQFIRRVDGRWVNVDCTSAGTDSLIFDPRLGVIYDYRGGSIFKETPINFNNLYLRAGGDRHISIETPDSGGGDDLTVKAGNDDDGVGGGNLYLSGGGTIEEAGSVYIGSSINESTNQSSIYALDPIVMWGNKISGLPFATEPDQPLILSQVSGLAKNIYSVALPY